MGVVLLTGGTGFVGRQVHSSLAARGHKVRLVLRPGSRGRVAIPTADQDVVETNDAFAEDAAWWAEACRGVDAVIHAAWYVEPGRYLDAPENVCCVTGSLSLAQGAAAAGVPHFVGIGTCFEYQLPSDRLDVHAALGPTTLYAASKVALYHMLRAWFAKQGQAFTWCRLFYLHGDGEHPARLVPYIRARLAAGDVAKLSAGTQVRDFLDVAVAGAMIANVVDTGQAGPVNICSGQPITVRALAEKIGSEYGRGDLLQFGTQAPSPFDPAAVVGVCNAMSQRLT